MPDQKTLTMSERIDSAAKEILSKNNNPEKAVFNSAKGTSFNSNDYDINRFVSSPCYGELGFDPFDKSLESKYQECESGYYSEQTNTIVISSICISMVIISVVLLLKNKRFFLDLTTKLGNKLNDFPSKLIAIYRDITNIHIIKFSPKINGFYRNIPGKWIVIIFGVWILFHLFMLLTSDEIFAYKISWKDFWLFDNWDSYHFARNNHFYRYSHYDISEFTFYVLIPLIIITARKYLKDESFTLETKKKEYKLTSDPVEELKRLKALKEEGVITEQDYIIMKEKIIQGYK